jgi:hypothetical protein
MVTLPFLTPKRFDKIINSREEILISFPDFFPTHGACLTFFTPTQLFVNV